MYGAIEASEAKKFLPTQSKERRRDFALRRQNASRSLTTGKRTAVLTTIFPSEKKPSQQPTQGLELAAPTTTTRSHHYSFVYTLLNPHSRQWQAVLFGRFISTVILFDVIVFILSTDQVIYNKNKRFFYICEGVDSCIFLVEYILRLVTCVERPKFRQKGPILGRIAYMITPSALLDLFATAPFFIEALSGLKLPRLTWIRVLRLFRILKNAAIVQALDAVYRVIYYNRQIIEVGVLIGLLFILVTAVLLYYLRPVENRHSSKERDEFRSIGATLYMSTLMLTGQGGPDASDLPWYTRAVVLLTAFISIPMFAIPASMLTWGFEAEAERMAKRSRRRELKARAAAQGATVSSTSSEQDISTDEEYFQIIAGEDAGEGGSEESAFMQEMRSFFDQADVNADGNLSFAEVLKMKGLAGSSSYDEDTAKRLALLEEQVNENTRKLDEILEILREQQKPRGLFR